MPKSVDPDAKIGQSLIFIATIVNFLLQKHVAYYSPHIGPPVQLQNDTPHSRHALACQFKNKLLLRVGK